MNDEKKEFINENEARQIIAGLIKQYPDENINNLRKVTFAIVNYIASYRNYSIKGNTKDIDMEFRIENMLNGIMPEFKILNNTEVELTW